MIAISLIPHVIINHLKPLDAQGDLLIEKYLADQNVNIISLHKSAKISKDAPAGCYQTEGPIDFIIINSGDQSAEGKNLLHSFGALFTIDCCGTSVMMI